LDEPRHDAVYRLGRDGLGLTTSGRSHGSARATVYKRISRPSFPSSGQLPASVADDADRLARFQREAEVLAALNHPNQRVIYTHRLNGGSANCALHQALD